MIGSILVPFICIPAMGGSPQGKSSAAALPSTDSFQVHCFITVGRVAPWTFLQLQLLLEIRIQNRLFSPKLLSLAHLAASRSSWLLGCAT
jgi:hypothetical protein